jgi:phospholipid transport system transporter-binding protein
MPLTLPTTATLDETGALVRDLEAALAALPAGEPLVVDAGAVAAFDTSLVAWLLHARRLAEAAGRGFAISAAPQKLAQLAELYGVASLLPLAADPAEPAEPGERSERPSASA